MDSLIGILVLIIYVVAAFSSSKKKAKANRQKRKEAFEKAFSAEQMAKGQKPQDRQTPQAPRPEQARPLERAQAAYAAQAKEDCSKRRVHLHEVTQQQMHLAGEGEDPCHAGGAPEMPLEMDMPGENEVGDQLAQDVLRGVIMSEILMRPCDRMALKRNRRSAR